MSADDSVPMVFVVDDEPTVARAIARLLRADGWRVKTFGSAEEFLSHAQPRETAHDGEMSGCLVLDVNLPGLDGLALQQQLRDAGETLPIVFLTGHGDIPMSVRAIKAGAADFLTKPVAGDALNAAIRAAIDQHAAQRKGRVENGAIRRRINTLTPREREVLTAVVAGKLNKQIAFDLGIVEQTVKYHRAHIMERMQAKSVAELMHIVASVQDQ